MKRILGQGAINKSNTSWELLDAYTKPGACTYIISFLVLRMAFEIGINYLNFLMKNWSKNSCLPKIAEFFKSTSGI